MLCIYTLFQQHHAMCKITPDFYQILLNLILIIFQFERDKRSKFNSSGSGPGGLSGGSGDGDLDELLLDMAPSEFYDENLTSLTGLCWADFVELVEMENENITSWFSKNRSGSMTSGKH